MALAQQAEPDALMVPAQGPWPAIGRAAMLVAGLLVAGYALRALGPDILHAVKPTLAGAGLLICGGALLCAVGLPRQLVAFAGGFAFGALVGGAMALVAQLAGCMAAFFWARWLGRDFARRRLRGRWRTMDRVLGGHPFTATLTLRMLPVGNNLLLNLLAGVSGLPAVPFLAATLIGYLPQTAIFAMLGSGVHVQRSVQVGLAAVLFLLSAGLGALLARRARLAVVGD